MDDIKKDGASLWDILSVIVKWRRLLVINFLAAAIFILIVSFFLPNWYTSCASIFPPEEETQGFGLASSILGGGMAGALSSYKMALPAFATPSDLYASILRSRVVSEGVVKKHDFQEVYGVGSFEKTLNILASHLNVTVEPEGIIRVSFEDKDPELAASVVNSFIEELNRVNHEVLLLRATATRRFIEERLTQTKIELAKAEEDYRAFQEEHKAISLDDQMRAMINNLAELKKQLVLAEIELGVLKRSFLPTHTKVRQQEAKIEEIKRQINLLGEGTPDTEKEDELSIPFSEAPDLSLQLVRLTRQLKVQETIYEFLTQEHEKVKIQEKKDTPTIQILDPPTVPEAKSSPRRSIMAIMAGLLSLLLTTVAVFAKEFVDRNKQANTETYRQLDKILGTLKDDFYALRSLFMVKKRGDNDRTN